MYKNMLKKIFSFVLVIVSVFYINAINAQAEDQSKTGYFKDYLNKAKNHAIEDKQKEEEKEEYLKTKKEELPPSPKEEPILIEVDPDQSIDEEIISEEVFEENEPEEIMARPDTLTFLDEVIGEPQPMIINVPQEQEEEAISEEEYTPEDEYLSVEEENVQILTEEKIYQEQEEEVQQNKEPEKTKEEKLREKYLKKGEDYLGENKPEKAIVYYKKVLESDPENKEAQGKIDTAERLINDKKPVSKKINVKKDKNSKKIDSYLERAQYFLDKDKYSEARKYAYKAWDLDPMNEQAALTVTEIDKRELLGIRDERVGENNKIAISFKKEEQDPMVKYDEEKNWKDFIFGAFEKKEIKIGDRINETKEYTIDECVEIALNRSHRMVVANKQIKLGEMRLWESRRDLWPELALKYEPTFGKINDRHYQGRKYEAEVKHTLFDGMGTWFKQKQNYINVEIVKLEKTKIENEIIESTKKAFYTLDKQNKALDFQGEYKAKVDEVFGITESAMQAEVVARVEYLKVKGIKMQTDFQYSSAIEDIRLAEMILLQNMNLEPKENFKIKEVTPPSEILKIGLENCYELATAHNPDFKIKEKTIEYYDLERKMMKAKGWPKITLQSSFGNAFENFQPTSDSTDGSTPVADLTDNPEDRPYKKNWYVGIKGSLPIWGNTLEYNYVKEQWTPTVSSFRGTESATSYVTLNILDDLVYFSNLEDARVGFATSKYEYAKAEQDLIVEVKERYFKYQKSLIQMEVAVSKIEHQEMYVAVTEERMNMGEMEMSRFLEEVEKLSTEKYSKTEADSNYYISLVELNKSVGIPDYFKPGYEEEEYVDLRKAIKDKEEKENSEEIYMQKTLTEKENEKIRDYFVKSHAALEEDKYYDARQYAKKILKIEPENSEAIELLDEIDSAAEEVI